MNAQPYDNSYPESRWIAWPVAWGAVWVGALAGLAVALIIGLVGVALGAHLVGPGHEVLDWHRFGIGALIFSVVGAFFAMVAGGWIAGRIAGIYRAEPAMLHGAIVWLLTVPMFLILGALGAGGFFGAWHSGLAGTPSWTAVTPRVFPPPDEHASQRDRDEFNNDVTPGKVNYQQYMAGKVTRNSALGAVTALLIGLIGSVIGGWLASGEPMHPFHHRRRLAATTTTNARYPVGSEVPHSV